MTEIRKRPVVDFVQFAWGLMLVPLGVIWRALNGVQATVGDHEARIAVMQETCTSLTESVDEARKAQGAIFNKIESIRLESVVQNETLRKEQREDFKEIRKAIAAIGQ